MPRLEHANIVVADIEPTLAFLKAAFPQWRVRGEGRDEWCGKPRRWLHFGDDGFYVTLNDNGEGKQRDLAGHAPGLAHLGFEVSSLDEVIGRLKEAGHEVDHSGPDHPHRRNAYFIDAAGLEFEFVEYLSDRPEERNLYV
jgi:catechol 2,3-dioxygenase-like lactoylglutathione lyase family enzyme